MSDVIEAASAGVRDMADGSLRITLEFEPRFARDAYALFGSRGTPVAVAALKPASSKPADGTPGEGRDRPFRGPLCSWVAIRCSEPAFAAWIETAYPDQWLEQFMNLGDAEEAAAKVVRDLCQVVSRRDLDTDTEAAARLHARVRLPYMQWLKANPQ